MRYGANDFLGEVVLELGAQLLDDEPEWYMLSPHSDSNLSVCFFLDFFDQNSCSLLECKLSYNVKSNQIAF